MKKILVLFVFILIGCDESPLTNPKPTMARAAMRQADALERIATALEKCECKDACK